MGFVYFYYYCIVQSEWRIPLSLNRYQIYSFRIEVIVLTNEKPFLAPGNKSSNIILDNLCQYHFIRPIELPIKTDVNGFVIYIEYC